MAGAFDEDAFDVGAFDEGQTTPYMVMPPTPPRGRAALSHTYQFFAGRPFTPAQALQPPRHVFPEPFLPPRGRPALAHTYQFFATSPGVKITVFDGFGAPGSATFVMRLEPGAKVTHEWKTTIISSYSGKEQRESPFGQPRRSFEAAAFMVDASSRDVRGVIQRHAAAGSTFLLALPFEELSLTADSSAQTLFVATTALCDWAIVKQRVVVIGGDGTAVFGVVQQVTSTTIKLDVTPGVVGRRGGRVMPLIQVLLESQQGFARYPVNVDLWTISARANVFGWCGVDSIGVGAEISTFTAGSPQPVSTITDVDLLIWDRVNTIDGTAPEAVISMAEILDKGALPSGAGSATVPDWLRSVKMRSASRADWQYWKAFTRLCRGRQRTWLLPTNRPDLVFDSTFSGGVKVKSPDVAGSGDYEAWFLSPAHRRLAIYNTAGSVQYTEVLSVIDNLDGTLSLSLDLNISGAVAKISFLELVRFERDNLEATWTGHVFSIDENVRAVQDFVETESRMLFDKVIDVHFAYSGTPPDVPPSTQTLFGALGKITLFNWTSDRTLAFGGIHSTAGLGNVDGMVVCVANVNNNAFSLSLENEQTIATTSSDRLQNAGLGTITGSNKATWYRYKASVLRWIQIG